jgi:hypothetical protein
MTRSPLVPNVKLSHKRHEDTVKKTRNTSSNKNEGLSARRGYYEQQLFDASHPTTMSSLKARKMQKHKEIVNRTKTDRFERQT